jgi:hypothetical protein
MALRVIAKVPVGLLCCLVALLALQPATRSVAQEKQSASSAEVPTYTAGGKLIFPAQYREWV